MMHCHLSETFPFSTDKSMSAAETLDITDLVFVNWEQEEFELSSNSDDDYSLSLENNSDTVELRKIDSSYIHVTSGYLSNYMVMKDDIDFDLGIILHLFDDFESVNTSDFPHLFVEFTIPSASIMVFGTLLLLGLLYFLTSLQL